MGLYSEKVLQLEKDIKFPLGFEKSLGLISFTSRMLIKDLSRIGCVSGDDIFNNSKNSDKVNMALNHLFYGYSWSCQVEYENGLKKGLPFGVKLTDEFLLSPIDRKGTVVSSMVYLERFLNDFKVSFSYRSYARKKMIEEIEKAIEIIKGEQDIS